MIPGSARRSGPVDCAPVFRDRWSPRAMSGAPLSEAALMRLFEAARWAPSANNNQPWRFLYARRDSPHFAGFLDLLAPANQRWCAQAGALVVLLSATVSDHHDKPIRTHSLDAGAAWQSLALQGWMDGLVVHGMAGFDAERARSLLAVPERYAVEMMIAIGHPAPLDALPEDLRARETPSDRRALADSVREGPFAF